jgi:hypothetical protein
MLLRRGGNGNVLEGVGGCSVSRSFLSSNSLNSPAVDSRVKVTTVDDTLHSLPLSEDTGERQSKCY